MANKMGDPGNSWLSVEAVARLLSMFVLELKRLDPQELKNFTEDDYPITFKCVFNLLPDAAISTFKNSLSDEDATMFDEIIKLALKDGFISPKPPPSIQLESVMSKVERGLIPNTALINILPQLQDIEAAAEGFDLKVGRGNMTAYTVVSVSPDSPVYTLAKRGIFTPFDACVNNAICSLWEAGNNVITAGMVYKTIHGGGGSNHTPEEQLTRIEASIEKMRHIFIREEIPIELTGTRHTDEKGNPVQLILDGYVLQAASIEAVAGGQRIKAYEIMQPLLLTGAKATNRLISFDIRLLNVKKLDKRGNVTTVSLPDTETRQIVKEYLLQRIHIMKRDHRNKKMTKSNTILFSAIYERAGLEASNKGATLDLRGYVWQCLDFWKAEKLIKGYTRQMQGRAYRGIEIELND